MEQKQQLSGSIMDKIKILIVEDEAIVALDIKQLLVKLGHEVIGIAKDYSSAIELVHETTPSLIFMDINLNNSEKDGIDTAIEIQQYKNIPIIYLTAFSDETTLNRAIATNPVSYLLKPYKLEDLKSIVLLADHKANRSNQPQMDSKSKKLGFGYYYNRIDEILYYENHYIKLSKNEKHLLNILIDAKGAIVAYQDIEYLIWPDSPVSVSSLRTLLYRLRAKLNYKLIETVHSAGCRLTPTY